MKKILCFGMGSEKKVGGIEIFLINMYRNINKKEIQFDFIKTCEGKIYGEDEFIANGSKIIEITSRNKNPLKHYKELNDLFKNDKSYDAVYVNLNTCSCISPIVYAGKYNKKIVVHSHNVWNGKKISSKILNFINQKRLKKYKATRLACSKEAGLYMFESNNFEVIKNGIELKKFKYDEKVRQRKRKELDLTSETVFINVGRLCYQKNQLFALDVFNEYLKKNANSKLLLVGRGEDQEKIESKIKEYDINEKVMLLGQRGDISELLQASDIFLFPSNFEGLGIALVEAEATGIDCYISDTIPKEAIISNKVTSISLKLPAKEWASKIRFNEEDRKKIYDDIERSGYDIKESALKLENILKSID